MLSRARHHHQLGRPWETFRHNSFHRAWHAAWRFFAPGWRAVAAVIVATALVMSVYGVLKVNAQHRANDYRRQLCEARVALVVKANPILAKGQPRIEDPCRYLAALTGEVVR